MLFMTVTNILMIKFLGGQLVNKKPCLMKTLTLTLTFIYYQTNNGTFVVLT